MSLRSFLIVAALLLAAALAAAVLILRPELVLPHYELTVRVTDARSGEATSARVQVRGRRFLFREADEDLWTHATPRIGPYVHVDGEVTVKAPRGDVQVIVTRGLESATVDTTVSLTGARTIDLVIGDWFDARARGWASADPHVHPFHAGGKHYPTPPMDKVARMARAEGLDLMFLLANEEQTPRGIVEPATRGTTLVWGEEYRNAFWGHMVALDAPDLVVTEYGATCCAEDQTAWPTLEQSLQDFDVPLAIMAHPRTTDDPRDTHLWPGAGYARELPALSTRAERLHGVSVGGGTNGPWVWSLEPWLDGLRLGRRWGAFGESDRALDRFHTEPPGEPRTYAYVNTGATGAPLAAAWIAAARRAKTYATTGPLLERFTIGDVGMGGVVDAELGDRLEVEVEIASIVPLDSVRIITVSGPVMTAPWPKNTTRASFRLDARVVRDAFVVVDAFGSERPPGRVYAPRLVTSPIWVRCGTPWTVPQAVIDRARAQMEEFWDLSLSARGYASAADSTRAFDHTRRPADVLADFDGRVFVPADW